MTRFVPQREQRAVSRLLAVLLVFLGVALIPPDGLAHAAETDTFKVEPSPRQIGDQEPRRKFAYSLEPGEAITDAIRITNKTEQPQRFRVYGADAEKDPATGAVTVETYAAARDGVGSWIELESHEVALEPQASDVVAFTLRMPDRSQPQGLGAVVVEEVKEAPAEEGIDIAYRVALTVQTTGGEERLHVAQPTLDLPLALIPQRGRVQVELRNGTLRTVSTTTEFVVEGVTGTQWELEPVPVDLAPGETKLVEAHWTNVPRWGGVFRVRAESTWEAGKLASTSPRQAFPPLWLLALVIVGVAIRGVREMWARHQDRRARTPNDHPAPDPDVLRGRLIEAALWLHAAGRDAPRELRETTAAEAQAVAVEARRAKDARDIEHAARSLAAFAHGLDDRDGTAQEAAHDFDEWFRDHRDDPRVKELVGA